MPQRIQSTDVFTESVERIKRLYRDGHRVVVSFSAGKDSGVCLELAKIAAEETGNLPVDVVMRDEEIMFPGTFEYAERVHDMKDVNFYWIIANQPVINIFNRKMPYFWVFDPLLEPEQWVRQPPSYAMYIPEMNIQGMINPERFPPAPGKDLVSIIGLRVQESINRRLAISSSKGYLTKPNKWGVRQARPIYDWHDGDVWKAVSDNKWDYNHAYDVMARMGVPRHKMRIAPPTLSPAAMDHLALAAKAWPKWFDKVAERLPGVRTAAMFGRRAVEGDRKLGETWEQAFRRNCIDEAPEWIGARAKAAMDMILSEHARHSTGAFPEINKCLRCRLMGSWKLLTRFMYMGDPFSIRFTHLPPVEPSFFRKDGGTWGGGSPTW